MPTVGGSVPQANLAQTAQENEAVASLLSAPLGHKATAAKIEETGVSTSEAAVRRYRERIEWTHPDSGPGETPRDMPVFTEYEGPNGRAALFLPRAGATEHDLLRQAGFDPDSWRIKGHVNTRKWMRYDQEWLFYYKFDAVQGESPRSVQVHVDDLVKRIRKRSKGSKFYYGTQEGTFVFVLSDWQIGKREGNLGTVDTVARFKDCLNQAKTNTTTCRPSRSTWIGVGRTGWSVS
jgi:hypothetical protein